MIGRIDYEKKIVDGRLLFNKFGRITSLDSADGEQLTISSTSSADDEGGTGAEQVYLYAIDSEGSTAGSF